MSPKAWGDRVLYVRTVLAQIKTLLDVTPGGLLGRCLGHSTVTRQSSRLRHLQFTSAGEARGRPDPGPAARGRPVKLP